jgi:hypothetical protein
VDGNQQIGEKHDFPFQSRSETAVLSMEAAFISKSYYSAVETINYVTEMIPIKHCRTGLVIEVQGSTSNLNP